MIALYHIYKKLIVAVLTIFLSSQFALAKDTLVISNKLNDKELINVTPYLYWVNGEDTILFSESTGLINQVHNFVFYVKNTSNDYQSYVIGFGKRYQHVYNIKLKSSLNGSITIIKGFQNSTPIELQPFETKTVSFTVRELNRDDPQKLSVHLVSPTYIESSNAKMYVRQSFFLGLFAFVCLFNLILYFVTGWDTYVKYTLFIFASLLYFLYFFGLLQEAFPWVKSISYNLVRIWYSLIFISYFYFVNDFGDYKHQVPRAYKLLNLGIRFKLIESIFNTILHYSGSQFIYSEFYKYSILVFEIILMGLIVYYILQNKNLRGKIVILAASIMIVGGIVDQVFSTKDYSYFMEIAVVVELLTFSVGLGYITKLFFQEKRESQQLYIEQLKENKLYQTQLTKQLEAKVKQRTHELETEKNNVVLKNKENELLLGEIHHRVKNNLQTINSLLGIQQRRLTDPQAIEAIEDSKNRILAMGLIHSHLYQSDSFAQIDFSTYVKELINTLVKATAINKIEVILSIPAIKINLDNAIFLGLIINEFAINSIKHAFKKVNIPIIEVSIFEDQDSTIIRFKDNGISKGLNLEKSNAFGWKMIRTMCEQLNATPIVNQENGVAIDICVSKEIIIIGGI